MLNSRILRSAGALILGGALLVGCVAPATTPTDTTAPAAEAPAEAAAEGSGGTIRAVETGGYYSLDPFVTPWFTTPQAMLYDTLVTTDLEKKDVPHLASGWEFSEDGTVLTFTLKEGVTFHDGTVFDAEAVKWNLEHYFNPETAAQVGQSLAAIVTSVDVIDPLTVQITMSTPYAPVFTDLGILYMVSPTAYQALGKDGFGLAPVGTGEFKFGSLVPDDMLTLVKNEAYAWAPDFAGTTSAPPADGLTVKYLADEAVIYASLETGELNIIGVPPQYLPQAEANPDIEIQEGIEWSVWYLGFNLTKAPFDDMNVRQAIAYAIDREEIILAGFDGKGYPLFGPLSPSITGFNEEVEVYGEERSNNIETALQYLADGGYADSDGDGIVEKDGVPLSIHLDFPNAAGIQRVAETIQAQLADIGIEMTISQVEAAAIADMSNRCEHDAFIRAYGLADATILASLTSPRVGGGNRICLSNTEFDELNRLADTTVGEGRQAAIDAEAKWLVDYRGHIPLMAPVGVSGYRAEVHDLQWDITGGATFFNTWVGN